MLVGVVAFNVLDVMTPEDQRAIGVLLTGYVFQGLFAYTSMFAERIAYRYSEFRSRFLHDVLLHLHCTDSSITMLRPYETTKDDDFRQVLFDPRSRLAATSGDRGFLDVC